MTRLRRAAQSLSVAAGLAFGGVIASSAILALPLWAALPDDILDPDRPWPVEVTLEARYDDGRLVGTEHLRWRNVGTQPTDELFFYLYLNGFRDEESTFFVSADHTQRPLGKNTEGYGWIEVGAARLGDGTALEVSPGFPDLSDRTVMRLALPAPIEPGEVVEIELDFVAQLPSIFARTGRQGVFVAGGQWFPHLAVYERDRWEISPFHVLEEFYADFGRWTVKLDLPGFYADHVATTGEIVEQRILGDRVLIEAHAAAVHDFAFFADPRFRRVDGRFDPDRDVPAELRRRYPEGCAELVPVQLRLWLPPERRIFAGRMLRAARATLAGLGCRLGAYPYPELELVDPPLGAEEAGGMEYATLATIASHPFLALPGLSNFRFPELVVIHEVGHQWWQGMVASDERTAPWLDEGVNSFYEGLLLRETFPEGAFYLLGLNFDGADPRQLALSDSALYAPIESPARDFESFAEYGFNIYYRAPAVLDHLRRHLGDRLFDQTMRAYFQRSRFRHPDPKALETLLLNASRGGGERRLGSDFFDQALRSNRLLDFHARELTSIPVHSDGEPWRDGDAEPAAFWRTEVVVDRVGAFVHPVEVAVRLRDGSVETFHWSGEAESQSWSFDGAAAEELIVDPEGLLALEATPQNNRLLRRPDPIPALFLSARWHSVLTWLFSGLDG